MFCSQKRGSINSEPVKTQLTIGFGVCVLRGSGYLPAAVSHDSTVAEARVAEAGANSSVGGDGGSVGGSNSRSSVGSSKSRGSVDSSLSSVDSSLSSVDSSMSAVGSSVSSKTRVAHVAKVGVAILGLGLSLGISRPLGNVDGSNRVSNVASGGSIAVGLVGADGGRGAVATDSDGSSGGRGSVHTSVSDMASRDSSVMSGVGGQRGSVGGSNSGGSVHSSVSGSVTS